MNKIQDLAKRKRLRLQNYDYDSHGAYFLTICTHQRKPILSKIAPVTVGDGAHDVPFESNNGIIQHTTIGKIVEKYLLSSENIPGIKIDQYVIMPNHIHVIIIVESNPIPPCGTSKAPSPTSAIIPRAVSAFKRFCNREIGYNIFQRGYHDHIIRNEKDYTAIVQYIAENPLKWEQDCFYEPY